MAVVEAEETTCNEAAGVVVPMPTPLMPVKTNGSLEEDWENTIPDEAFTPIEPYDPATLLSKPTIAFDAPEPFDATLKFPPIVVFWEKVI